MPNPNYRIIKSIPFITLDRLIAQLQEIIEENQAHQVRTYVLNENDDYLTHIEVLEMTLSDGSRVRDIRLVRKVGTSMT
jgi:hypothetical protein